MLDRFVPVAGMLLPADVPPSRAAMLESQHRADLRLVGTRPTTVARFAAAAVDRVRTLVAPGPAARPEPICCPA